MNFKEKIEERGLKKMWVANKIGISAVLLSYYLNDTRPMPDHIDQRLKEILA